MASQRPLSQAKADLDVYLNQSFNRLIATTMRRLATKKRSPVYTGFFASSWQASSSPIIAKDRVEAFAPWSEIRKRKTEDPKSKEYKIIPRFYPPDKPYNYKKRVYIGNTAEYSVYALESGKVQQFVQGPEMRRLVTEAFDERKARISIGARQATGAFGTMAGRIYTGYTEL
tara:strand:- start:341 stop:856 length:516 start_codon:yes stop_codon:yes gene_type:complete